LLEMSSDSPDKSSGGSSPDKGKKLRSPHPSTLERLRNGELDPSQSTMVKSTLSVDAPEFIPKFAQTSQPPPGDGLYQQFQKLVNIRPSHLTGESASQADITAGQFKDAVFRLTSNPGPMKEYLRPVIDALNNHVTDKAVIDNIIETLFEQSISEANFRFTGAKICKYLSEELKNHTMFSPFRGWYLKRCQTEFEKRDQLINTDKERLCGLAMYFGELFLVLEIERENVVERIAPLRVAICDILSTLLSQPDDVSVKCSCKLLKLTGTALMETTQMAGNFDDIFAKIKSLEKSPTLDKTSHCLINSVLSRLEYNFGVGQQSSSPEKPARQSQQDRFNENYEVNEPVFYNTQGQPIGREEAGYSQGDGQGDSDFEGLNSEEQAFFLQCEAENYANQQQQWMDAGPVDEYVNQQQQPPWMGDQGGDNLLQQQYGMDGGPDYARWSSSNEPAFGYEEDVGDIYAEYGADMDDEMIAAYEMFLTESGQQNRG